MAGHSPAKSHLPEEKSLSFNRSSPQPSPRRGYLVPAIFFAFCLLLLHYRGLISWPRAPQPLPLPVLSQATTIPKQIWYKAGPERDTKISGLGWAQSCTEKSPDWHANVLTDESADEWVQMAYASRPDIVEMYQQLSVPLLKTNLLRFLVLYSEGGVWSDLDVACETPIDDWILPQYKANTSLLVAWDLDHYKYKNARHQLATWTVAAKPGLFYFKLAIEGFVKDLHSVAKKRKLTISEITVPNVVGEDYTGPGRMTASILIGVRETLGMKYGDFIPLEEDARERSGTEQVLLGDVLFMPYYAMSWETDDMFERGSKLVTRHLAGTWEQEKGGQGSLRDGTYKPLDVLGGGF